VEAVGILSVGDFEAALTEARATGGKGTRLPGLAAPIDAALAGRVDEVWDRVEGALRDAWRAGKSASKAALDAALAEIEGLLDQAGAKAVTITDAVFERLRTLMRSIIDRALANVRATVVIGDLTMRVKELSVDQKVTISGSLSASITEMWKLTSNGELTVGATYERV
jgi:hypothetical protein